MSRRGGGGDENDDRGLGCVGDRRQRVRGEDRQREGLREQRLLELSRGHRPADDRPLQRTCRRPLERCVFHAARSRGDHHGARRVVENRPHVLREGPARAHESRRQSLRRRSRRRGCRARRRPPPGRSRRAEPARSAGARRSRSSRPEPARGRALRRGAASSCRKCALNGSSQSTTSGAIKARVRPPLRVRAGTRDRAHVESARSRAAVRPPCCGVWQCEAEMIATGWTTSSSHRRPLQISDVSRSPVRASRFAQDAPHEAIARAGLGEQVARARRILLDLPSELRHVDVEVVRLRAVVRVPRQPEGSSDGSAAFLRCGRTGAGDRTPWA